MIGKIYITFIVLLTIFCGLSGCKDECRNKLANHLIDNQMKAYMFKEGTYWVYENSTTGEIDSQIVVKVDKGVKVSQPGFQHLYEPDCGDETSEFYFMSILDSNTQFVQTITMGVETVESYEYLSTKYKDNLMVLDSKVVYSEKNAESVAEMNVQGVAYSQVQRYTTYDKASEYYWCKSIGIIRKVDIISSVPVAEWNLVRYKIVQ